MDASSTGHRPRDLLRPDVEQTEEDLEEPEAELKAASEKNKARQAPHTRAEQLEAD